MDYQPFVNAIQGAQGIQAPATPYAELANMMKSSFQLPVASAGASGVGAVAGMKAKQEEQSASMARQKAIDAEKDKISQIKDMFDPNKYKQVRREDGGFDYYDPQGKQIQLNDYAKITGKKPADILKDSENSVDLQYLQDYKSLQELANAFANGDKEYLDGLPDNMKEYLKGKTMKDIMNDFKQQYPQVYGLQGQAQARQAPQQDVGTYPIFNDMATAAGQPQQEGGSFLNETLKRLYDNRGMNASGGPEVPSFLKQFGQGQFRGF